MTRKVKIVGGSERKIVLELSLTDLFAIQAALREVQQELQDWEFEVRMGVSRNEVQELLEFLTPELRAAIAALGEP
ncbi:hypothetical protein [Sorangium cellulosum]|uniref:Uncharacterized protein n=1 Tax=Sorangium cellulosum So0157-2 TaxID=1254432 RepID=S4YEH0_SORCE|nr:hypothetical protein [Sorangium cellulosum]AGP41248.1 hypothetical protein SCE1572_46220 [Sorangium cellulosum So0157-2]